MKGKFIMLLLKLKKKGLSNIEVAGFLTDFRDLKQRRVIAPLNSANLELENLGWGVHIMDMALYKDLISLFEEEALEDFKYYLQQIASQF
ncbi:MAG: hypothetical protein JSU83_03150 [Deltaproteobacteria bacterium]|nr:MAG: hypothetical protein JSU83_03150 [Deltaproteobacteria bacterium]